MSKIEYFNFTTPRNISTMNSAELHRYCESLRALADEQGDSEDRFIAESACMSSWHIYELMNGESFEQTVQCARRMLDLDGCNAYVAGSAATLLLRLRCDLDVALALIRLGLQAAERIPEVGLRCWDMSFLLANRVAILAAIDPRSESVREALADLSGLTYWHVEFDEFLTALEVTSDGGPVPYQAAGALLRTRSMIADQRSQAAPHNELLSRIDYLISRLEPDPLVTQIQGITAGLRRDIQSSVE